jgi:hypothetical protein
LELSVAGRRQERRGDNLQRDHHGKLGVPIVVFLLLFVFAVIGAGGISS